jgi:hypothetical protein
MGGGGGFAAMGETLGWARAVPSPTLYKLTFTGSMVRF